MRIIPRTYHIKVSRGMIDGYYRYLTLDREFRYQCYVESEVYKIIYKKLNL